MQKKESINHSVQSVEITRKEYKKARRNKVLARMAGFTMIGLGVGGTIYGMHAAEGQYQERMVQLATDEDLVFSRDYLENMAEDKKDAATEAAVALGAFAVVSGMYLLGSSGSQRYRQDTATYHINYLERF